jgi:Flp pilus assembly protein TadG
MRCRSGSDAKRGMRGERGAIAVEFAIILPVLLLLIFGALDLAHAYYIQHIVTTASREGARYAAKYTGNPPVNPTQTQITAYVTSTISAHLNNLGVQSPAYTTVPGPPSYRIVTITVTAHKHWWILNTFNLFGFVPFPDPKTMTGTTAMRVEF